MKNSLWIIIALVTGIVGFLVGYSVSGYTGARGAQAAAQGAPASHDGPAAAASGGAPAHRADAGGYAGASGTAHAPAAGGYGAQPAQPAPQKVASEKPKAAGY
jgi:hypothetical protein